MKNNNYSYIHIPFCESKCKYCKFASFGNIDEKKVDLYIDYLLNEIKTSPLNPLLKGEGNFLKSIYFGGGTPSILSPGYIEEIIKTYKKNTNFDENIEITLETNPSTIKKEKYKKLKQLGINRVSIGIQTLNVQSLKEIGRLSKLEILNGLDIIKEIGFENVSVDFIIGLPYVKSGEIKKDIDYLLEKYSFIKHVSVYMLEEQYYPESWADLGIKEDEYLKEYVEIKDFLKLKGYNPYEISNFAKKGYECNHNIAYWNHENVIGFGLGAHSFYENTRYANSDKFIKYYSGEIDYKEDLNNDDLFLESVMFRLRTNGLKNELYDKLDKEKLEEFISEGFLLKKDNIIKLSNKGILVIDYILKNII